MSRKYEAWEIEEVRRETERKMKELGFKLTPEMKKKVEERVFAKMGCLEVVGK